MAESRASVINFSTRRVYVSQDAEDNVLVERCRNGDSAAFEPIVERYQRLLFTVALRMLGDHDEASDAAQNAFVKAYQKLDTFDQSRRFFSWIYRILLNECLNLRRDRHPHEQLTPELATVGSPVELLETTERRRSCPGGRSSPPHRAARGDRVEALRGALVRRDRRGSASAGQDREVAAPYRETATQPDAGAGFPS